MWFIKANYKQNCEYCNKVIHVIAGVKCLVKFLRTNLSKNSQSHLLRSIAPKPIINYWLLLTSHGIMPGKDLLTVLSLHLKLKPNLAPQPVHASHGITYDHFILIPTFMLVLVHCKCRVWGIKAGCLVFHTPKTVCKAELIVVYAHALLNASHVVCHSGQPH